MYPLVLSTCVPGHDNPLTNRPSLRVRYDACWRGYAAGEVVSKGYCCLYRPSTGRASYQPNPFGWLVLALPNCLELARPGYWVLVLARSAQYLGQSWPTSVAKAGQPPAILIMSHSLLVLVVHDKRGTKACISFHWLPTLA